MRNQIRIVSLMLLLFFGITPRSSGQQPNFLYPDPGTPKGEGLTNVIELPGGSLVFCGSQDYRLNDTFHSDAVLLKTNARGAVISQKIFSRPANTTQDFPFEILPHNGKILLLSAQDTVEQSPNIIGKNRLRWRLLDTALITISEKIITLTPSYFDMLSLSALQVADTTFVTCLLNNTYGQGTRTALFTLDASGNLIAFKYLDLTFFGWGTSASVEKVKSISLRPATFNRPGGVVVSCNGTLNQPIIGGRENFLLQVNAHLNLTDTFDLSSPLINIPADTILSYHSLWEAIPLPGGDYMTGSRFAFDFSGGGQELLGASRYNSTTHKFQTRGLVPAHTYTGVGIRNILGRSLAGAGNHFYAFGYTYGLGFRNPENSWVVARYDSNANLLQSRSFSDTGYEYTASHIEALRDGGALLLGSRNRNIGGIQYQSDYFAIRLDAAGKVVSVPEAATGEPLPQRFSLSPNPGTGRFTVTDTKGKLQEIHIYNIQGRLFCRQKVQGSSISVDLTHEPAGVYLLQIHTTDGAVEWLRLVVR